jgi:hypothetical protein
VAREQSWCKSVRIIEHPTNRGIAKSVISGVTELTQEHGTAIVLEDDLVVASSFLTYMNEALRRLRDEPKVMQVGGFMYPMPVQSETDAVFLPFTTSWGWATWHRAWRQFDPTMSGNERLRKDRALRRRFNLNDAYPYSALLKRQFTLGADSRDWDIAWYLSTFLAEALTVYPASSLVQNIGFDGTGTHSEASLDFAQPLRPIEVRRWPTNIALDQQVYEAVIRYLQSKRPSQVRRLARGGFGVLRQLLRRGTQLLHGA